MLSHSASSDSRQKGLPAQAYTSVLVQRGMERGRSPLVSIFRPSGGDFQGIGVYLSDVVLRRGRKPSPAPLFILSMSPPDYLSAWLRPRSAASVSPGEVIVAPQRPVRPTSVWRVMRQLSGRAHRRPGCTGGQCTRGCLRDRVGLSNGGNIAPTTRRCRQSMAASACRMISRSSFPDRELLD
jgi:hypothetical protein